MASRKLAISLPPRLVDEADRLARAARTSRSGLIARLIEREASHRRDREITERIDRVYADPRAQAKAAAEAAERYEGERFGDAEEW